MATPTKDVREKTSRETDKKAQTAPKPPVSDERKLLGLTWRRRAKFQVGKTRPQRRQQYNRQLQVLGIALAITVGAGLLFIWLNWQGAGSTKSASCADYPQYCVPLTGGLEGSDEMAQSESASVRRLDQDSQGADGVVRGFMPVASLDQTRTEYMPFIGNPDAPLQLMVVEDFACPHCQDYHEGDLSRVIKDFVLEGKATLGVILATGTGRELSKTASQAALCAGEQGAFWEMADEFFRLAQSMGIQQAFSDAQIEQSAETMGLNANKLMECLYSGRYAGLIDTYPLITNSYGVTGTPTVLYRYGDTGTWTKVARDYNTIKGLIDNAP